MSSLHSSSLCNESYQLLKVSDRLKPAPLKPIQKRISYTFLHIHTHIKTVRYRLFNSPVRSFLSHLQLSISRLQLLALCAECSIWVCVCDFSLKTYFQLYLTVHSLRRLWFSLSSDISRRVAMNECRFVYIYTALDGATHRSALAVIFSFSSYRVSVPLWRTRNFFDFIIIV